MPDLTHQQITDLAWAEYRAGASFIAAFRRLWRLHHA
jgi:hypothetical protein